MKKFTFIFAVLTIFAGCTETPPQWWDPSGKYTGATAQDAAADTTTVKPATETKGVNIKLGTEATDGPQVRVEDTFTPINAVPVEIEELPLPSVLSE
ncbi:hypothetical protein AAIR98_000747 [Elusimicrobium simillimum]|uniref:hypothetical protein n=1 Tax=Elusimicrobium simillimum TaxID=3143438 RepID=UPI003C6EDD21